MGGRQDSTGQASQYHTLSDKNVTPLLTPITGWGAITPTSGIGTPRRTPRSASLQASPLHSAPLHLGLHMRESSRPEDARHHEHARNDVNERCDEDGRSDEGRFPRGKGFAPVALPRSRDWATRNGTSNSNPAFREQVKESFKQLQGFKGNPPSTIGIGITTLGCLPPSPRRVSPPKWGGGFLGTAQTKYPLIEEGGGGETESGWKDGWSEEVARKQQGRAHDTVLPRAFFVPTALRARTQHGTVLCVLWGCV